MRKNNEELGYCAACGPGLPQVLGIEGKTRWKASLLIHSRLYSQFARLGLSYPKVVTRALSGAAETYWQHFKHHAASIMQRHLHASMYHHHFCISYLAQGQDWHQ